MRSLLRSSAVRWNVVGVVVVLALVVALWPRAQASTAPSTPAGAGTAAASSPAEGADATAVPAAELAAPRAAAALQPCPSAPAGTAAGTGPLAGLTLDCLGAPGSVDLGTALAGKPAVLDLWAWNCAPCAQELPAMQDFARRAGSAVTVLTVHSNPASLYGLQKLAQYGVHLPAVQDPTSRVAALVGAPQVLPVTVLLHADGSVVPIPAEVYTSADAIAAVVQRYLGVTT